jgi:uncharacterized protein YndB with AHSA1/START domain
VLRDQDHGALLIGDISGYTGLLVASELDHAQDVLRDLMRVLVDGLRGPFHLAKLEGDAAFVYAIGDRFDGSTMLDTLESAYGAFRRRLDAIDRATSCDCNACVLMPRLDLKFVAHQGAFVRERLYGTEELTGTDVIIVHRLLKNRVTEETGTAGYAFLTDAFVAATRLDPTVIGLREHRESYDDVGEVHGWVHDLRASLERAREQKRVRVGERATFKRIEGDLPVPPSVAWTMLTDPSHRVQLIPGVQRIDEAPVEGRRGIGTRNHCVHGDGATLEEILDWRPFEYFTLDNRIPGVVHYVSTTELTPTVEGTHVTVRFQRPRSPKERAALEAAAPMFIPLYAATFAAMHGAAKSAEVPAGA